MHIKNVLFRLSLFKLRLLAGQQGAVFSFRPLHSARAASLTQWAENMLCVDAGFVFAALCGAAELSSIESPDLFFYARHVILRHYYYYYYLDEVLVCDQKVEISQIS